MSKCAVKRRKRKGGKAMEGRGAEREASTTREQQCTLEEAVKPGAGGKGKESESEEALPRSSPSDAQVTLPHRKGARAKGAEENRAPLCLAPLCEKSDVVGSLLEQAGESREAKEDNGAEYALSHSLREAREVADGHIPPICREGLEGEGATGSLAPLFSEGSRVSLPRDLAGESSDVCARLEEADPSTSHLCPPLPCHVKGETSELRGKGRREVYGMSTEVSRIGAWSSERKKEREGEMREEQLTYDLALSRRSSSMSDIPTGEHSSRSSPLTSEVRGKAARQSARPKPGARAPACIPLGIVRAPIEERMKSHPRVRHAGGKAVAEASPSSSPSAALPFRHTPNTLAHETSSEGLLPQSSDGIEPRSREGSSPLFPHCVEPPSTEGIVPLSTHSLRPHSTNGTWPRLPGGSLNEALPQFVSINEVGDDGAGSAGKSRLDGSWQGMRGGEPRGASGGEREGTGEEGSRRRRRNLSICTPPRPACALELLHTATIHTVSSVSHSPKRPPSASSLLTLASPSGIEIPPWKLPDAFYPSPESEPDGISPCESLPSDTHFHSLGEACLSPKGAPSLDFNRKKKNRAAQAARVRRELSLTKINAEPVQCA